MSAGPSRAELSFTQVGRADGGLDIRGMAIGGSTDPAHVVTCLYWASLPGRACADKVYYVTIQAVLAVWEPGQLYDSRFRVQGAEESRNRLAQAIACFSAVVGLAACGLAGRAGVSPDGKGGLIDTRVEVRKPSGNGAAGSFAPIAQLSPSTPPSYDQLLAMQRLISGDQLVWFREHGLTVVMHGPKNGWLVVYVRSFTPEQDLLVKERWGWYVRLEVTTDDPRTTPLPNPMTSPANP